MDIKNLKQKYEEAAKELEEETIIPLLRTRKGLMMHLTDLEKRAKEVKQEVDMIDSELESTMRGADMTTYKGVDAKCCFVVDMYPRVEDPVRLFEWMKKTENYDLLSANMIKKTDTNKLIDAGVTPDGVKLITITKFKVYKGR